MSTFDKELESLEIDNAGMDSFPASDPPAWTGAHAGMPSDIGELAVVPSEEPAPARKMGRPRSHKIVAAAAFAAATLGVAALGTIGTKKSVNSVWYTLLRKSKLQPSRKAFGPVWTGLYALIAVSGYRVWAKPKSRARSQALALWGAQLGLNGAWTWIFFGARKPVPALAEIGVLAGSIALYMRSARRVDPLASMLVVPYLGWVGFASLLNGAVVRKNPRLAL